MTVLTVIAIPLIIILARTSKSWVALSILAVLVTSMVPVYIAPLEDVQPRTFITDIAGAGPALSAAGIAILSLLLCTLGWGRTTGRVRPVAHDPTSIGLLVPFGLFGLIAALFAWPSSADVRAGVLSLTIGLAAWIVGSRLGGAMVTAPSSVLPTLLWGIAAILTVEAAMAAVQILSGSTVNSGRGSGTFSHPATLGKYFLLLLPILLPAAASSVARLRKPAMIALVVGFVGTGLTVSRANILATAAVLIGWSLLRASDARQRGNLLRRAGLPIAVVFLSLPFVSLIIERVSADPDGGDRQPLLEAGLRVIANNLALGAGPNNYVVTAINSEPIVAMTGYPVHNTFLLGVAELGFVGSLLYSLPLLAATVRAARVSRVSVAGIEATNMGRAFLLTAAAVVFVGFSGWGFWQEPTLALIFLVAGYVHRQMWDLSSPAHLTCDARQPARLQSRAVVAQEVLSVRIPIYRRLSLGRNTHPNQPRWKGRDLQRGRRTGRVRREGSIDSSR